MASDDNQDEPKTERFNMFMSPSEMKAIDDWAWENRVRSKSEAVRRLVQIGLAADANFDALIEAYVATFNAAVSVSRKEDGSLSNMDVFVELIDFAKQFGRLRSFIVSMRGGSNVDEAFAQLAEALAAWDAHDEERAIDQIASFLSDIKVAKGQK